MVGTFKEFCDSTFVNLLPEEITSNTACYICMLSKLTCQVSKMQVLKGADLSTQRHSYNQ